MATSCSYEKLTEGIKKALTSNNPGDAVLMIKQYLETEKNIPLNIAITGECGSGKSTFVNVFRGLENSDEGAAPTGCEETTIEVTPYKHLTFPNVTLWDLPGIGTTRFPSDKYLKHVGFEKFDFFIIISDTRFRENDVKLAKEIKKMGKRFYFVRSKIDNDLRAEKQSKKNFSEEECLETIRKNCVEGLKQLGIESPRVFLVSNFELHQFEFYLLHETLEKELPEHKRHTLLIAMPNISLEIIEKKKKVFHTKIKYIACVSAIGATVPIPGLSTAVDAALLATNITYYIHGFGLDYLSLNRLSAASNVPLESILGVLQSQLAAVNITKELILQVLTQSTKILVHMEAEEAVRWIPLFGIPAAMTLSFTTTYQSLQLFLNELAKDAQNVLKRVLGLEK